MRIVSEGRLSALLGAIPRGFPTPTGTLCWPPSNSASARFPDIRMLRTETVNDPARIAHPAR